MSAITSGNAWRAGAPAALRRLGWIALALLAVGCADFQKQADDFCNSRQNASEDYQACVDRVKAALIERQRTLTRGTHPEGHES